MRVKTDQIGGSELIKQLSKREGPFATINTAINTQRKLEKRC
jgi:hypothetical protein